MNFQQLLCLYENRAHAESALLLKLNDKTIQMLQNIQIPEEPNGETMTRLDPSRLHATLISFRNFKNEPDRESIARHDFEAPEIVPGETRFVYRPGKVTYVLSLQNQKELKEFVDKLYSQVGKTNPEPNRFFRVTLANNMGGDPFKSIGDVTQDDFKKI